MTGQKQRLAAAAASSSSGGNLGAKLATAKLPQCLLELWSMGRMNPQTLQQVLCGGIQNLRLAANLRTLIFTWHVSGKAFIFLVS